MPACDELRHGARRRATHDQQDGATRRQCALTFDSPALLLLHGQPGGACDWDAVTSAVGGRAIAIDRPGWDGRSQPTDLAGNARAAFAALDARGIDRATVVGHSLGGAVAAWIAASHPDRVAALVLVAPAANVASLHALDRWLAAPVAGYATNATALAGLGLALTAGPLRRRIAHRLSVEDRYLRAAARRLLSPTAWRAFTIEQRALLRDLPPLEQRLHRISAPTTIVAGSADRLVPVASARALAKQISGAELVVLERAGHLVQVQFPQRIAEIIGRAVQSPPSGAVACKLERSSARSAEIGSHSGLADLVRLHNFCSWRQLSAASRG